jgi:tRNA(Ile)-lysidine synthase
VAGSRFVVAVSGGVDSVALLHMLSQQPNVRIIVAHFDHGIRDDSSNDAVFVKHLAQRYGHMFVSTREELGSHASEDLARSRRYAFLRSVASEHNARIMTAHHSDDSIETIAINTLRGTGWRGLAVLDSDIVRPLLRMSKQDILTYATHHRLEWHEDSTNATDAYLRNRVRRMTRQIPAATKSKLLDLHAKQITLKKHINHEVKQLVGDGPVYGRYFFIHAHPVAAIECLRYIVQARLTRPQLERALIAIKTAKPGAKYQAGDGVEFIFTSRNFVIELIK